MIANRFCAFVILLHQQNTNQISSAKQKTAMNTANYFNVHTGEDNHQVKTIKVGGVKSTMCLNRFELLCEPGQEIREELILQMLQEWVEMREREM